MDCILIVIDDYFRD